VLENFAKLTALQAMMDATRAAPAAASDTLQAPQCRESSRASKSPEHFMSGFAQSSPTIERAKFEEGAKTLLCLAERLDWRYFCGKTPKQSWLPSIPEELEY